ncbi:MAG: type VI secretion system contractile sheath large subunit [Paracoccaceae bacterium]
MDLRTERGIAPHQLHKLQEARTPLSSVVTCMDELAAESGGFAASGPDALSGQMGDPFGTLGAPRPDAQWLKRDRFRIALFGDFSGRAARGLVETGDALAARRPIPLEVDTVEEVIEGFATTLMLPIGGDGAWIEVPLNELDDLHPDELYENVDLFSGLAGLKRQLANGATAEAALTRLREWGEAHGTPLCLPKHASAGGAVPADRRLSDFQKLIGDHSARLGQASPVDDLVARVVGPHVVSLPDSAAMAAVDDALSAAMRLVLHNPEFQLIEAQWRTLDFLARRIETDDNLELVLYDISAEEIAADLAATEDLAQSGFLRLLTDGPMGEDTGRGGYSALFGLYRFEETPTHAELLGRIARVAAHVDAPFVSAIGPGFIDTPTGARHRLVAEAWDHLRAMPEAGHLGLATPRFLLRRPYGAKSDPISAFGFEEFNMQSGLSGMLWANPAAAVAVLMAQSFTQNGKALNLGSVMQLGDIPFHYVTDRYGDQVALPCTERNVTESKIENIVNRGLMPVVSIRGRDEIRLTSFQSLAGTDLRGPWSGERVPTPPAPRETPDLQVAFSAGPLPKEGDTPEDRQLDELLAAFAKKEPTPADPDAIDADLAALLEDL